jgi:hypothetical protein
MALSSIPQVIVATATGASDHVSLPPGRFTVDIYPTGTNAGTLQRGDGTNFNDVALDATTMADFSSTGQLNFEVAGSGDYRLQVDTFGSALRAEFKEIQRP